jgi:xylan 1,4-beta-xylosidase
MSASASNPVIPGFHPDPSWCRVDEDYWLVTSSFEWFPGVPIFHSRDLVHWRLVGNVLDRPKQLPLAGIGHSGGIWAPTLRWHQGRFYLITTVVGGGGNLLVTATDPAGPWSDPLWIDANGYDPSLFFDDNGSCFYTKAGSDVDGNHGIVQCRIEVATGRLLEPFRRIWTGSGGFGVEGPHLYHIGEWYFLLCAEGATHVGHMVTIARSRSPFGPFVSHANNPILSHRNDLGRTILATGHGDMLQAHDGSWWMVCLGIRSHGSLCMAMHLLGRETCLTPVTWTDDQWPLVNGGQGVPETVTSPLADRPWDESATRDDFDHPVLAPYWTFLRNPQPSAYSLSERPGHLRLRGMTPSLETTLSPAMVVRRQEHRDCRIRVKFSCILTAIGDEVGLTVFLNGAHHQDFGVVLRADGRYLQLRRRADDLDLVSAEMPIDDGTVLLEAWCNPWAIGYFMAPSDRDSQREPTWQRLAKASTKTLTTEFGGGFTGLMLGVYALGSALVDIDWIDYGPCERMP